MTVISKSTIDTRSFAKAFFAIGGTTLFLGIFMLNLWVILAGIGILATGILMYFYGKSTYTVTYDEKIGEFELKSRQDSHTIKKEDVLGVKKRWSFSQLWWPLPRPFYYVLSIKHESRIKKSYRFVIWSHESQLLRGYDMLKRSVETWTKRKNSSH